MMAFHPDMTMTFAHLQARLRSSPRFRSLLPHHRLMSVLGFFFATYGAVFIAEIVGDKLLYTTGVLSARYRAAPIMIGMVAAFMAKMGVAVLIGEVIARLPRLLVAAITAASFVGVAIALWRKDDEYRHERDQHKAHRAAMISFAAIFFSEWGDV